MGYLDNTSITVDAILTKKGRALLSEGEGSFKITQFALADDEIDYSLWNITHPSGSNYYGALIEQTPLLEAFPDETQSMRFKLVTLAKNTTHIPVVSVGSQIITLTSLGQEALIKPNTLNFANANATLGYTAILSDSSIATLTVIAGANVTQGLSPTIPVFLSDSAAARSVAVIGREFKITAKANVHTDKTATITLIGNETGGSVVINLTVNRQDFAAPSGGVS